MKKTLALTLALLSVFLALPVLAQDVIGPALPSPDSDFISFLKTAHTFIMAKEWGKLIFFGVTLLVWLSRKFFEKRVPLLASPVAAIIKTFLLAFTGMLATTWPAGGKPTGMDVMTAVQVGFAAAGGWSIFKALLEAAAKKWDWAKWLYKVATGKEFEAPAPAPVPAA